MEPPPTTTMVALLYLQWNAGYLWSPNVLCMYPSALTPHSLFKPFLTLLFLITFGNSFLFTKDNIFCRSIRVVLFLRVQYFNHSPFVFFIFFISAFAFNCQTHSYYSFASFLWNVLNCTDGVTAVCGASRRVVGAVYIFLLMCKTFNIIETNEIEDQRV